MFSLMGLLGGDNGISQTVGSIIKAVNYSLREPNQAIRQRAESILRLYRTPEGHSREEVKDLFDWVKNHFHYVKDPPGLEYIKSPEVSDSEIKINGAFMGDCDDVSAYLAALLKSIGYPVQLVVITAASANHNDFTHIFVRALVPPSKNYLGAEDAQKSPWITLDGTAKGKPFGWQAPAKRERTYNV